MKKRTEKQLLKRIKRLEKEVLELRTGTTDTVFVPYTQHCTCYEPWHGITPPPPCPVHGMVKTNPITVTTTTAGDFTVYQ